MVSNARSVFISRLQGLQVLDASGDQVGKVHDVVVQARLAGRPRVRGLVVELFARRRIFVPMLRVHAIDVTQISIVGVVDTRRFDRRASEVLVMGSLWLATAIRTEASLSFIGLGAVPPTAEWGAMIKQGADKGLQYWWYALVPGVAIMSVVMGLNFFGDGLRDALDPKRRT